MNHEFANTALKTALAALCATLAGAAGAQSSRIERVTVYPGLAEVERSVRVAAGARELVLNCLSADFDMAGLRVDADSGVRLGPVTATDKPRASVPECRTTPQDARIKALEDDIARLKAQSEGHELVLGYLRALAPSAPAGAVKTAPAANLPSTLTAIQRSGQTALVEQHRIARETELLERELKPLIEERDRLQTLAGEVRQVRIALSASQEGMVRLRYQVPGPTWAPAYRATLETAAKAVSVERLAQVAQNSGEDWLGVSLRLSTGSPRAATQGPQPRPWEISPRPKDPPLMRERAMAIFADAPAPAPMAAAKTASARPELDFAVQVQQSEFATEFEVPGRVDVAAGNQRVNFSLGSTRLPVQVSVQTTPRADASAWLVAELARPEGVWPDGSLQLVRGNEVVGQSVWRSGVRERMTLPFGRDEQVRVQVIPVTTQTGSTGFITTRAERRESHLYEVENRHPAAIDLYVLEASPVATDEQINISRSFNPAPKEGWWREQPGIVAWQQSLAPGAKARFAADYTISTPKDLAIIERR